MTDIIYLKDKSKIIRRQTFDMVINANKGHLGGSLSCVEILVTLYYGDILEFDLKNPKWENRDIFIMSKGHANNSLYVILADLGFFPVSELNNFSKTGCILGQHCDTLVPGIEVNSGSLGHGLGIASGIALGYKLDKRDPHIFVLLGDGECQEGSIWEAAMLAAHHKLDNLVAIIDRNGLSSEDFTENTSKLEPLKDKFEAFGWRVKVIDGHSIEEILEAIEYRYLRGKPLMIIANTIKGKGVSWLENLPRSHHTIPKGDDLDNARKELEPNSHNSIYI